MASLGATDEDLARLATVYWYTVEAGMCLEGDKKKVFGASLLSSVGEFKNSHSDHPGFYPLDCEEVANNH